MRFRDIGPAWGKILRGHKPLLSLEITKECPLRCPGCYAYEAGHLGASGPLRQLNDYKGEALVGLCSPSFAALDRCTCRLSEENL